MALTSNGTLPFCSNLFLQTCAPCVLTASSTTLSYQYDSVETIVVSVVPIIYGNGSTSYSTVGATANVSSQIATGSGPVFTHTDDLTWDVDGAILTYPTTYVQYTNFSAASASPATTKTCTSLSLTRLRLPISTDPVSFFIPLPSVSSTRGQSTLPAQILDYLESLTTVSEQLGGEPASSCSPVSATLPPPTACISTSLASSASLSCHAVVQSSFAASAPIFANTTTCNTLYSTFTVTKTSSLTFVSEQTSVSSSAPPIQHRSATLLTTLILSPQYRGGQTPLPTPAPSPATSPVPAVHPGTGTPAGSTPSTSVGASVRPQSAPLSDGQDEPKPGTAITRQTSSSPLNTELPHAASSPQGSQSRPLANPQSEASEEEQSSAAPPAVSPVPDVGPLQSAINSLASAHATSRGASTSNVNSATAAGPNTELLATIHQPEASNSAVDNAGSATGAFTPATPVFTVGTQTFSFGGGPATFQGSTYSALPATAGVQVAASGSTTTIYPGSGSGYAVPGATAYPGGSAVSYGGTTYSALSFGAGVQIAAAGSTAVVYPPAMSGYNIAGTTIVPGGSAAVYQGTTYSALSSGSGVQVAVDGFTTTVLADDLNGYAVAGTTIFPGGSAVVLQGTTYSALSSGSGVQIAASGITSTAETGLPSGFVVAGNTLIPGGSAEIADGTTYSVLPSGSGLVIAADGTTATLQAAGSSGYVVDGAIITAGGSAAVEHGTTYSALPQGSGIQVAANGATTTLSVPYSGGGLGGYIYSGLQPSGTPAAGPGSGAGVVPYTGGAGKLTGSSLRMALLLVSTFLVIGW